MSEHHHHHDVSGAGLFWTIVLNIIITVSQIVGGILSGSLALLSDAMHNFSDVAALLIAWIANRLAKRPGSMERTFGYKRAEILAALFNASVLIGIAIFLMIEAVHKWLHPEPIQSMWVIGLGLLSILLNAISVLLVKNDAEESMNIRAAYLHLMTDVMTSVAVVIGGVVMYYWGIVWIDPLISVLIALYLIRSSWGMVRESTAILMQFAPEGFDTEALIVTLTSEPQIANVHHLHLWRLDDHRIHLEAHLDFAGDVSLSDSTRLIDRLEHRLHDDFGIEHATFQCEYGREDDKQIIR